MVRTAVLVDGGFFLKRYFRYNEKTNSPKIVADFLYKICESHLEHESNRGGEIDYLYRVFYYDCAPLSINVLHPITNKVIDFTQHPEAIFRKSFFEELKKKKKVALRIGHLQNRKNWKISSKKNKALLSKHITVNDLEEKDVTYDSVQKGADIKIGVDIASLALKKQVERIVLISGDADFVSAAKLARREGIIFILDNLGNHINPDLYEHIDDLSCSPGFHFTGQNK